MPRLHAPARTTIRLFAAYAVVSALPVIALGLVLAASFRAQARHQGLGQGRREAALIARTAVAPLLDGRPLSDPLSARELRGLRRLGGHELGRDLLRLRLRDRAGRVVYAAGERGAVTADDGGGDGDGERGGVDESALRAARGATVSELTRLGADVDDDGEIEGPRAVEIYLPLAAGQPSRRVGVLELYLPYAPIDHDISTTLSTLYRNLAIGLGALYLALFVLSASVSARLRRASARNAFLADHDTLTGLPNRGSFLRHVQRALADARQSGAEPAVAIVDLDRFQDVNDTLGHRVGDAVLCELARRLQAEVSSSTFVARLGGDEFGLVIPAGSWVHETLWRVRAALQGEVAVDGLVIDAQASVGYALAGSDGGDADTLVRRADVAMYAAKERHTGVTRYEPALEHFDAASLALAAQLRHAVDDDQLVLHYQPQQRAGDGGVVALEALVRWQHPQHGLLFPDRFLPLAEQTDVIDRLTRWVVRRALRDMDALAAGETDAPRVAVNVSARSLGRGQLADDVLGILSELGVDPGRLIVEVTETAILADPARAAHELARIAGAGVKISLDDFGRGQTSLGYLSGLPLHELKIDRSFVGDMDADRAHAAIVRAMVDLGHNLGLQVVAEGVETEAVATLLQSAGADLLQGYLFSRPLALDDVVAWLRARRGATATV